MGRRSAAGRLISPGDGVQPVGGRFRLVSAVDALASCAPALTQPDAPTRTERAMRMFFTAPTHFVCVLSSRGQRCAVRVCSAGWCISGGSSRIAFSCEGSLFGPSSSCSKAVAATSGSRATSTRAPVRAPSSRLERAGVCPCEAMRHCTVLVPTRALFALILEK